MDPRQRAIQQAMQGNQDPTIMGAIAEFARTGIPPADPRVLAVINAAFQQNGVPLLPTPTPGAEAPRTAATPAPGTGLPTAGDPGREAPRATGSDGPGAGLPTTTPGLPTTGAGGASPALPSTTPSATPASPLDPTHKNAVNAELDGNELGQMRMLLRQVGVDPDNLGLSGSRIQGALLPIMQAMIKTSGLLPGQGVPGDEITNRLGDIGSMFNGPQGFYGQLQGYGNQLAHGAMDKIAASKDVGMQNEYLKMINMLTNVGGNDLTVQTAADEGKAAIGAYSDANVEAARTGAAKPNNYIKWLQGQQGKPAAGGFADILRLVNGGR